MTQSLTETVAAEIRAELGRQQTSAAELAKRLGVSGTYVWRRLNGQAALSTDDLERISDALGVSVTALLGRRAS